MAVKSTFQQTNAIRSECYTKPISATNCATYRGVPVRGLIILLRGCERNILFYLKYFTASNAGGMNRSSTAEFSEGKYATESGYRKFSHNSSCTAHCEKRFQERGNCFGCAPMVECPLVCPSHRQVREVIATPRRQSRIRCAR